MHFGYDDFNWLSEVLQLETQVELLSFGHLSVAVVAQPVSQGEPPPPSLLLQATTDKNANTTSKDIEKIGKTVTLEIRDGKP